MKASQCGTPDVEFHLELAALSSSPVQCDFFCCVFSSVWFGVFFSFKDDLQCGEMLWGDE